MTCRRHLSRRVAVPAARWPPWPTSAGRRTT